MYGIVSQSSALKEDNGVVAGGDIIRTTSCCTTFNQTAHDKTAINGTHL